MLNKLKYLNYQFGNDGSITQVTVGFNEYQGEIQGNLTVILNTDDGDFEASTPKQLQGIARSKAIEALSAEEPPTLPEEE